MSPRARILGRAAGYGLLPPAALLFGVSQGALGRDPQPFILGSALWVTLALALASLAWVRLQRRAHGR